jgi:hypothetical protein
VVSLPLPVVSSSGPQRAGKRAKETRYDPVKSTTKEVGFGEGEHEDGWDAIFVRFQAKLRNMVRNRQPPGGLSFEMALVANLQESMEEDLKRSVSRIFYCVLVHRPIDSAILATAIPEHQGRRGKTPPECGGLPHQPTEGNPPSETNPHPGQRQIER